MDQTEQKREYKREWYKANRDRVSEYNRKWQEGHQGYSLKYYQLNHEKMFTVRGK